MLYRRKPQRDSPDIIVNFCTQACTIDNRQRLKSFLIVQYIASSKEVWKILPSYEELRRGAIRRVKEIEVM